MEAEFRKKHGNDLWKNASKFDKFQFADYDMMKDEIEKQNPSSSHVRGTCPLLHDTQRGTPRCVSWRSGQIRTFRHRNRRGEIIKKSYACKLRLEKMIGVSLLF